MKKQALLFLIFGFSIIAHAQLDSIAVKDSIKQQELKVFTILEKNDGLFTFLPGSVSYIRTERLNSIQPFTLNEILRKIPGVHVADEEGAGMRLNIGIRGMDPDRSRGVHMMEDGIPVAMGPYGENEAYYSPFVDRMSGIEIIKGSGQILYGPQTVGGIINFITADPPEKTRLNIKFMGGTGLNFLGSVNYGQGFKNGGFTISYIRKQGEQVGPTWYRINDVVAKLVLKTSEKTRLIFKAGFYNEISNSTYIGLTQNMWENGQNLFVQMAPDDRMVVNRFSASMMHEWRINNKLSMTTTMFGYRTSREWRRQEFSSTPTTNMSGVIWGDTNIIGGAVYMKNSTGLRNRYFDVAGVENKFSWNFKTGKIEQRLDAGIRFIYERANEYYMIGASPSSEVGIHTSNEFRNGYGLAVYAQDKLFLHKKVTATIGVRGEFFWFDRTFNILSGIDTLLGNKNFIGAIIPGIGLNYKPAQWVNIYTGLHRGFAPPRVKDAINGAGIAIQLNPEDSWNVELGARFKVKEFFSAEVTGFYMDFINQVVPQSVSSGSSSSALVNGGATRHAGIELAFNYDLAKHLGWNKWSLGLEGGFTYQYAVYSKDRFAFVSGDTLNLMNNTLPYAPSIMANAAIFMQTRFGLQVRLNLNYVGQQFADDANTIVATADGRKGLIPGYVLLDANIAYKVPVIRTTIRLSAKNLTNNEYIASRRPTGIKVGLPFLLMAGFEFQF